MAKYLDQTGAQHLAEALMNSTKTVGGQTIWGDGDIEVGGGNNGAVFIELTSASDVSTYNSVLKDSTIFKVVRIKDIACENLTIYNAIVTGTQSANYSTINSTGTLIFVGCHFVPLGILNNIGGSNLALQTTGSIRLNHCTGILGGTRASVPSIIAGKVDVQYSDITLYVNDSDTVSIVQTDRVGITNSIIRNWGFKPLTNQCEIYCKNKGTSTLDYSIINKCIGCDFSTTYVILLASDYSDAIQNTSFENCSMPITQSSKKVFNVLRCKIPANSELYVYYPGFTADSGQCSATNGWCAEYTS